jgi:hypothetical protein
VENTVQKEYEGKVPYSKSTVRVQGVHRNSLRDEVQESLPSLRKRRIIRVRNTVECEEEE